MDKEIKNSHGCLLWAVIKSLSILKLLICSICHSSFVEIFYDNADGAAKMTDIVHVIGQLTDFCTDFTLGLKFISKNPETAALLFFLLKLLVMLAHLWFDFGICHDLSNFQW